MKVFNLEEGQILGIPCKIFPGAFNHEVMVIIDTPDGEVSGFVKRDDLLRIEGDAGVVRARVVESSADFVRVLLTGSYFTTTGLAEFPPDWTRDNAELHAAA